MSHLLASPFIPGPPPYNHVLQMFAPRCVGPPRMIHGETYYLATSQTAFHAEALGVSFHMFQAIGSKYGISMQKDEPEGLRKVYGQMLETIIPIGSTELK